MEGVIETCTHMENDYRLFYVFVSLASLSYAESWLAQAQKRDCKVKQIHGGGCRLF